MKNSQDHLVKYPIITIIPKKVLEQSEKQEAEKILDNAIEIQFQKKASINLSDSSQVLAINYNSTLMVVSVYQQIYLLNFINSRKILQKMSTKNEEKPQHTNCFKFLKRSSGLISSATLLIIWKWEETVFKIYKKLAGHKGFIQQFIVNQKENQIVSCGDNQIIFWDELRDWEASQIIQVHQHEINAISFNETESKLVSISWCELIIFDLKDKQTCIVLQIIKIEDSGYRACFIANDIFVFSTKWRSDLIIFEYNEQLNRFVQHVEKYQMPHFKYSILCDLDYFLQQFNKQTQILVDKQTRFVNLIKQVNGKLKLYQTIKFNTEEIFATLSDDGRFLATWDSTTNSIQIRIKLNLQIN